MSQSDLPGDHPIIPVMLHDARRAPALADALERALKMFAEAGASL